MQNCPIPADCQNKIAFRKKRLQAPGLQSAEPSRIFRQRQRLAATKDELTDNLGDKFRCIVFCKIRQQ